MSLQRFEPLAIVGLACRLPGAATVDALWAQAVAGQSALTPCPEEWGRLAGIAASLRGGRLEDQPFDWLRFRIPPTELKGMHRIERCLVEGLALSLLDAGMVPRAPAGARTALYLAATGVGLDERIDHRARLAVPSFKTHLAAELERAHLSPELADAAARRALEGVPALVADTLSTMASVAAGRVAQLFELEGGQFAADCGYASSLAAVKLAGQSLALGHCDTAVVGAVSPLLSASTYAVLQARGWLSSSGTLHPLDELAAGTVPGEGIIALVLRRLDDALADRQRIYAVLRGISEAGELAGGAARLHRAVDRAARTAVARAEVDGDQVAHVEVAASGIVSLEEDELLGLRGTYGFRAGAPLTVSTGAAQAGFQQAASGLLSMVRATLALHHRQAAPTAGLASPRTRVLGELVALGTPRRLLPHSLVGVSSLAPSGSVFHAVLGPSPGASASATRQVRRPSPQKLAIIGTGTLVPGAVNSAQLWKNIIEKVDAIGDLPADRSDISQALQAFDEDRSHAPRLAGVVQLQPLNPLQWKLSPVAAAQLDPSVRMALAVGEQAVLDAGYEEGRWDKQKVGVVLGQLPMREREQQLERRLIAEKFIEHVYRAALESGLAQPTAVKLAQTVRVRILETLPPITEDTFGSCTGLTAAARVAARFGFGGGALSVDAACASTLAAVHVAGFALAQRELDVVIAGGVAANLIPEYYAVLMALGFLSSRGSFPFDDRAEGFVPSEGGAAVVLKRLEDAEAAKDRILAVITGIGASSDGKATTLFAPDISGRRKSVERALEHARTEPGWVDIIEGHGSGTRRSDETEVLAYAEAFYSRTPDNAVALGAVKSQIGHLSSAGAAASLVKMAHALANKTLPPMNGGEYPNPEIPFHRLPVSLALEARPWRTLHGRPRRAGVSGFGLGGSNYHVVLEEAPAQVASRDELEGIGSKPHPQPPRGLFADRWKVSLTPLALQPESRFSLDGKRVLLLTENDAVAEPLRVAFEQAGARVQRLRVAGAVDPLDVEQRVRAAVGPLQAFDGVIDACEFARAPDFLARGTAQFARDLTASSARWYGTARALYKAFASATPRSSFWLALTAMGGDFGFYGDGGNVLGGGIAGFLKGLKQELPGTLFKVIDFEATLPPGQVAQVAVAELSEGSDRVEVGYLAGRRFVPTLLRAPFPPAEEVLFEIDPAWVVVFSGGGRGAVFEVAKAMARLGTRVVLTGRTPMPDANAPHLMLDDAAFEQFRKEELLRLRRTHPQLTPVAFERMFDARVRERELFQNLTQSFNAGLPLQYEVCDVSDRAQVEALMELIRRTHGRVDGIVHGAMTESSKSLPDKTPDIVASTLSVKVNGLLNLLEATEGDDLKIVACFGSGAGRFGNKGQSDYCAANDLMAKCAMAYAHRARPGVRCVTIDWTAWESVGAAARSRERVEKTGVSFIPPAEGVYWFLNELMLGGDTREVAIFDERLFREWACMGNSAQGPRPQRVWDDLGAPLVPSDTPLVDAVLDHSATSVTVGRRLDIETDRFLLQHRLYGVPILPGTFGFELMAEVASLLRPELTVLRGMDLHIDVPLKLFRGEPVQIQATARMLKEENGEVTAEVTTRSELRVGSSDIRQTRVHHRGLFVLGQPPTHVPGTGVHPTALPGARGRSIFHLAKDPVHLGPLFCRAEFVYVGERSVEGIIRAPRQRDIFSHMTRPFFLFDPLLMDGAFQVAANWDGHHHNLVSVPMGATSLVRGRIRRLSESAHVRATMLEVSGRDVLYDVTVLGEDGALLLHIHRLWLRRLSAGGKDSQ